MTDLVIERDGAIATVVLNRPEKLNALTRAMWQQLGETIERLSADDSLRCVDHPRRRREVVLAGQRHRRVCDRALEQDSRRSSTAR